MQKTMALKDLTYYIYNTPFGQVTIGSDGSAITALSIGAKKFSGHFAPSTLTNTCSTQVLEYLCGKRTSFDVPIRLNGSDFQIKVWKALQNVLYGEVITPQQLAKMIGKESSFRRIPVAAHANKISIIVPNHRLVPASNFEKPSLAEKMRHALRTIEKKHALG